jgi:hypothetical protein
LSGSTDIDVGRQHCGETGALRTRLPANVGAYFTVSSRDAVRYLENHLGGLGNENDIYMPADWVKHPTLVDEINTLAGMLKSRSVRYW